MCDVMAKSLSLSDAAYAALLSARRPNESLSDVVLRLHAAAAEPKKEPKKFLEDLKRIPWAFTPEERMEHLRRSRAADRRRAKELEDRWRS